MPDLHHQGLKQAQSFQSHQAMLREGVIDMAMTRCGKCGKAYPKGDKAAEIAHNFSCTKGVIKNGLYWGPKHEARKASKKN